MIDELSKRLKENVKRVLNGKDEVVELSLAAILAGGHVLLEDVPGTGKTMLARSLAISLGLDFKRIQFTPDLLPTDVTGLAIYRGQQSSSGFEFVPGPIFTNVLLADEINRATPKTQSALLEAMAENQVSADGQTHLLPKPFIVIATQNPIELDGTYRLPEAQLDRFLIKLSVGYPNEHEEIKMLENLAVVHPIETLTSVVSNDELLKARQQVRQVHLADELRRLIVEAVQLTRNFSESYLGASPRASLALQALGQALAAMAGRSFVTPDDIVRALPAVLAHRLLLKPEARLRGITSQQLIEKTLAKLSIPLEK